MVWPDNLDAHSISRDGLPNAGKVQHTAAQ